MQIATQKLSNAIDETVVKAVKQKLKCPVGTPSIPAAICDFPVATEQDKKAYIRQIMLPPKEAAHLALLSSTVGLINRLNS